jgi:hypothetical protein
MWASGDMSVPLSVANPDWLHLGLLYPYLKTILRLAVQSGPASTGEENQRLLGALNWCQHFKFPAALSAVG